MIELPQYRCHKVVRAAKIVGVAHGDDLTFRLKLDITKEQPLGQYVDVDRGWAWSKAPAGLASNLIDGYYVVYEDGYASFSPAEAFEAGYTLEPTDWRERLVAERVQLDERIDKLHAFVGSAAAIGLPKIDQRDLTLQLDCMNDMAAILARRLERAL